MRRRGLQIFLLIFSSLCIFNINSVKAETVITDSEISVDTTWTKVNSPYIISGDLIIDSGVTLTIEPGVIVKMENSALYVDGKIVAEGTENEKIYFTSFADDSLGGDTNGGGALTTPSEFDYDGIRLWGSDPGSHFSHAVFQYASIALDFDTTTATLDAVSIEHGNGGISAFNADISLKNSHLFDLSFDAVDGYGASKILVASSIIEDLQGSAFGMYNDSMLILKDSTIKNLQDGTGVILFDSFADIQDSTFENITRDAVGVYNSKLTFKDSSAKDNDWGSAIYAQGTSDVTISGSSFDGGFNSGVEFYGNSWSGQHSSFSVSNSTFQNYLYAGISAGDIVSGSIASSTIQKNFIGLDVWNIPLLISGSAIKENDLLGLWNESDEKVVDAKNNWWGDVGGPYEEVGNPLGFGNEVMGAVNYTPWLSEDPFLVIEPECCSSVAFLPGIEGSRLYKQGLIFEDQLWEPNYYSDVEALHLDANGKSKDPSVYTKDVIDSVNIAGTKIYRSFMDEMDGLKTAGTISDWEPLPYYWRLSADDTVANPVKLAGGGTYSMVAQIENLAANSKTGKVTLIAHSMGGIVSKALIKALEAKGEAGLIDKLILVASPQIGTPQTIGSLLHGYGEELFHGLLAGAATMRTFGENLSGAYQLLPSAEYFTKVSDPVVTFDPSIDTVSDFRQKYGESISTKAGLQNFLLGADGRAKPSAEDITLPNILNSTILTNVNTLHDNIDSYQIPSDIAVTQIAGWGLDTIKGIKYQTKDVTVCADKGACQTNKELDMRPIFTEDGDGTVVVPSAAKLNTSKYFFDFPLYNSQFNISLEHKNILESSVILDFLKNKIIEATSSADFITSTEPDPVDLGKQIRLSGHSPISLDLYDSDGHHTGLISIPNSDFNYAEEQIPNSYYFELGDGKYVGFPDDNSTNVKISGTGIGTFTLDIERVVGGQTTTTSSYADIPVFPTTQASLLVSATSTTLSLDLDGNGAVDFNLAPTQELDSIAYFKVMKNIIASLNLSPGVTKPLLAKIDNAIKMLQKSKVSNVQKRISSMLHQIEIKNKKKVNKKIDSIDAQFLVTMLTNLLDNLPK
ncbi:MAG: right-handed parallel beta-helix repeat-containing protein [Candidatus Pacebacteria bacterium]|nr:right-handed parallel beta-helix repeat-containing protein [Candidatus Paceibacterota bacterium]